MPNSSADRNPVEYLAEEFAERFRKGERPSLSEYTEKYPQFADEIRDLFPALVMMENLRPTADDVTGGFEPIRENKKLERLGDFRILREVGRGGMGIVYEAEQISLGRHVALKVLPSHALLDPKQVQRFEREARAAARLHHTNIVPVYGVGESDGLHYYVMQFIQGQALDQVLRELKSLRGHGTPTVLESASVGVQVMLTGGGPPQADDDPAPNEANHSPSRQVEAMSATRSPDASSLRLPGQSNPSSMTSGQEYWRSVARVGVQVADAIAYASGQGTLHRDIKPSNLILDTHATVWITDFGLAKAADSADLTHPGDVLGTLRYMAPERFHGQADIRSDIYALGLTLYELVTLQPAFAASDQQKLLQQVMHEEPLRPRKLAPSLPRDLETIILKSIARDPEQRYQTPATMAEDLRRYLEDRPIEARRASSFEKGWRWARRNPWLAGLVTTLAVLLMVIAVGALLAAASLKRKSDAAHAAEENAKKAERDLGRELIRATLNEVRARRSAGQHGQRFESLEAIRTLKAKLPVDLLTEGDVREMRDEAAACLALPDVRETGPPRTVYTVTFRDVDMDGSLDAYVTEDPTTGAGVVRSWKDSTRETRLPPPPPDLPFRSRFISPDGKWVAEILHGLIPGVDNRFRVWDWAAGRLALDVSLAVAREGPTFHPDGKRCAIVLRNDTLCHFDLETGREIGRSPPRFFSNKELAFSPDGQLLAVINFGSAEILDVKSWKTIAMIPHHETVAVAWHPNGRELAVGNRAGSVLLWNRETRQGRLLDGRHVAPVNALHYAGAGRWLISSGDDNRSFVRNTSRGEPVLILKGRMVRVAPDGRRLGIQHDNKLIVYELTDDVMHREIPGWWDHVEFDPLGRWVAASSGFGCTLHSVDTLLPLADLGLDRCGPPVFRPDGSELVSYGIFSHLLRWPIATTGTASESRKVRLGPPSAVGTEKGWAAKVGIGLEPQHFGRCAAWSHDGQTLAWADDRKHKVYVADAKQTQGRVVASYHALQVAVNRDGTRIAVADRVQGIHVLRVQDGQSVLHVPSHNYAAFSPDGRFLVTSSPREFRFWRTNTWESERVIPREDSGQSRVPIAFRHDSKVVALPISNRKLSLVDPSTGLTLTTLTYAEPTVIFNLSFHPSGDRLGATRAGNNALVWDLSRLHQELSILGLAWNLEPTPFLAAPKTSQPIQVVRHGLPAPKTWHEKWLWLATGEALEGRFPEAVDATNAALVTVPLEATRDRAHVHFARGSYHFSNNTAAAARDDWRIAQSLAPDMVEPAQGLARLMVLGPPELREAHHGLQLALANFERDRTDVQNQLILAAAYVRNGRHKDALSMLDKIPANRRNPLDGFLRAVSQHHLGNADAAAKEFAAARTDAERLSPSPDLGRAEELRRLRQEADEVLRLMPPR